MPVASCCPLWRWFAQVSVPSQRLHADPLHRVLLRFQAELTPASCACWPAPRMAQRLECPSLWRAPGPCARLQAPSCHLQPRQCPRTALQPRRPMPVRAWQAALHLPRHPQPWLPAQPLTHLTPAPLPASGRGLRFLPRGPAGLCPAAASSGFSSAAAAADWSLLAVPRFAAGGLTAFPLPAGAGAASFGMGETRGACPSVARTCMQKKVSGDLTRCF